MGVPLYVTVILALLPIIGTIFYHVFIAGKLFSSIGSNMEKLSVAITNLDKTFFSTVSNLEKTFNLKLDNLSHNFQDMKNTQEKFAEVLNDIVIKQMREMDKDITRISESTKSAHHRLDCIERKD